MSVQKSNSKPTIHELIMGEREFLHGISSPLMVAMSHLELMQQKGPQLTPEQVAEKITKVRNSLEKVSKSIFDRRVFIKNLQEPVE